jgi:hypothetical protein
MVKFKNLANMILLWVAVLSALAGGAVAFVRTQDAVNEFPKVCSRVSTLETQRAVDLAVNNERWDKLFEWTRKVDRRLERAR